jgi:phospholipase C
MVSPWTRGGNVFAERADHNSDIMFVEQWAAAHGYKGVYSQEMSPWRRAHMSNLVNALDFANVCLTEAFFPAILNLERTSYMLTQR